MTKEEFFKMHYSEDKIQSSGVIIRHHNPAFDGIINSGFVHHSMDPIPLDSPSLVRFNQHLYNNGNARTIGEETIPMTTFGKDLVHRNGQILDASKLS